MIHNLPAPPGVTFNLLATQTPTPLVPASFTGVGTGATGPFSQGMVAGVSQNLNMLASKAQTLTQGGCGGLGVLQGLDLSPGTGPTVLVSKGTASVGDLVDVAASSVVLPITQTSYVWLTAAGVLAFANTIAPPSAGMVYLGAVVTNSTGVVSIDYSGRVYLQDGARIRQTAEPFAPGDAPPSNCRIITLTLNGTYLWDGQVHAPLGVSQTAARVNSATLTGDLTLSPQSNNLQWLVAGANHQVVLPPVSSMALGTWFKVVNAGDASLPAQNYNLTVVASLGGAAISTLAPGQSALFAIQPPSGGTGQKWPTSVTAQVGA